MRTAKAFGISIGQAAKRAGVNIQTFRYYERIGLVEPLSRTGGGYRVYSQEALDRMQFIKRAQELGFSLEEIREFLELELTATGSREKVRKKAELRLKEIKEKIRDLRKIEKTLSSLVEDCKSGLESGPCPILTKMRGASL